MGLSLSGTTQIQDLTGTYKDIGKETLAELKKAGSGKITPETIEKIEAAAKVDGNYSDGEKLLIDNIKNLAKDNKSIGLINFVETSNSKDKTQNVLTVKGHETYVNEDSKEDISKAHDSVKKSIDFSKNFLIMQPSTKEAAKSILDKMVSTPPQNIEQLKNFEGKIPSNLKPLFSNLGVDKLKTDKDVQDFFSNKTISKLPKFVENLNSLDRNERDVAIRTLSTLSENPPKVGYRDQIKKTMDALGKDSSIKVGKALNELNVYIPATNAQAPTSEDASSRFKTMHMGTYSNGSGPNSDYIRDALDVAGKEGFTVAVQTSSDESPDELKKKIASDLKTKEGMSDEKIDKLVNNNLKIVSAKTDGYEWAEDNKFFTIGGEVKTVPLLDNKNSNNGLADPINKAVDFSTGYSTPSSSKYFTQEGHHSVGGSSIDPDNLANKKSVQGAVTDRQEMVSAADLGNALGEKVTTTRTYNEGGNMLVGTLPNGDSYAVLGRDGALISAFKLEEDYKKDKTSVPEFDKIPEKVGQMEKAGQFPTDLVNETVQKLKAAKQIPAGTDPNKRAKEFLATVEIVKDEIFPKDIGIKKENLVFVAQPDFHVDMHLRPLKPGQVMINDFSENIKFLEQAKSKATKGSWEETKINEMIENSTKMKKVMDPIMNTISSQLKAKGIDVVRAPGVMESNNRDKMVNFMNAASGTSIGTNRQFYMTNYTSIKPIRDAYEEYMKKQGVDKIYWIGDTGGGKSSHSASETSLNNEGGMDCRENREEL